MKKLEKILRKHIEAVKERTSLDVSMDTDQAGSTDPCTAGGRPDRGKICAAVKEIRSSAGNYTGSNRCARQIQSGNTNSCSGRSYLKFANVKIACEKYQRSVRDAMPPGSSSTQIAEAERKAMCDCLNFVRYGEPKTLSGNSTISDGLGTKIGPNEFANEISSAYDANCNYIYLGGICDEIEKTNKLARDMMCT